MQKRTLKQKCLAWVLSLAVALTFIPLTAGFAFADDSADYNINLEKANGGAVESNEVKTTITLAEPWASDTTQVYTGKEMKPELAEISCKMGVGQFTLDSADANGNKYFTVDYGEGDWTAAGSYTFTVVANEAAAPVAFNFKGTDYTAKFVGSYSYTCTIASNPKDLALGKITLSETKVAFDNQVHKPTATVVDSEGNTVKPEYYEVTYPDESKNAYSKVGTYDVVATAKDGNAGGYVGSITGQFQIFDEVNQIAVNVKHGKNGAETEAAVFKEDSWEGLAKTTPLKWGYKGNVWESKKYVPLESLLAEAGLGTVGQFGDQDTVTLYSNSVPQPYTLTDYNFGAIKEFAYTADADGKKVTDVFGDESTVPAFLILDTEDRSATPMMGVGYTYNSEKKSYDSPSGFYFCKPVSIVVLQSMNINGLDVNASQVKNKTYTGKAFKPAVTVKDGKEAVPVTVTYKNNKGVGKATVKATAQKESGYYGTVTKTFKIVPKKAAVSKATAAKKKMTVKMKTKVGKTGGAVYQIAYKVKGTSKWKYTTTKKQSKVIKKLKKGKKYQVKVRAYKVVNKVKYYGAWSKVKTTSKIK